MPFYNRVKKRVGIKWPKRIPLSAFWHRSPNEVTVWYSSSFRRFEGLLDRRGCARRSVTPRATSPHSANLGLCGWRTSPFKRTFETIHRQPPCGLCTPNTITRRNLSDVSKFKGRLLRCIILLVLCFMLAPLNRETCRVFHSNLCEPFTQDTGSKILRALFIRDPKITSSR